MLSVYLGKMDEAVYYPPVYFDNRYEDKWITDKRSVEIIRDVDKSDVVSAHLIESPVLGPISPNSATGKTTLINMLRQAENLGADSGVDVNCDVPCRVLEGRNWKVILESISKSIIFIDEENVFINTEEFASAIQNSDNYYVLITRENLYDLPYSVEEIYGLHSSGKYQNTRKVYQQMYRIYSDKNILPIKPEKIIVEDSNSGYDFFQSVSEDQNLERLPTVLIL